MAGALKRFATSARWAALWRSIVEARWGITVAVVSYFLFAWMYAATPASQAPGSDGHYTWLFARSLVYDHDIDFKNDYELCGDPNGKNVDRGTGHPDNPFYVGPAVTWAPLLWVLRHTVKVPPTAPENVKGACTGPLVAKTLWQATLLGALTLWLMYRIGRRFTRDGPAALAAALLGWCSSLPAYATLLPSYSHIHDTFWAAATVLLALRASERPRSVARWAIAGACVGINLLQRPVSVCFGVLPATLLIAALYRDRRALVVSLVALGGGAFLFGVLPQILIYKYLYGHYWAGAPHGRYYMQYGHAHPWLVLFAPHGGLFFVAPSVWIAVAGIVVALRDESTQVLATALLLACTATVWVSAVPLDWYGSGTFGARRLTSMLPLCAPPTAIAIERVRRWMRSKPSRPATALGLAVLVPAAFAIVGAAFGLGKGQVKTEVGMSQSGLYGVGSEVAWSVIDDKVGDLAILPAELAFRARYRLPMNAFRDATEPLYVRDYRTLSFNVQEINLRNGQHANVVTGFARRPDGMQMTGTRATLVFAAQWPFATSLAVQVTGTRGARVRVGRGGILGTRRYGVITVGGEAPSVVAIPPGGFDSGLVELVFERSSARNQVVVQSIKIEDSNAYPDPI